MLMFLVILVSNPGFVSLYVSLFFLVLLHELGHSLMARRFGAATRDIMLWPFGGIATVNVPVEPKAELCVALAGPAVNAALVPVFFAMPDYNFWNLLGYYNLMLLVFNLLPAFPMDGGRALRSLLTFGLKDQLRATRIAARIGQGICIFLGVYGLLNGWLMLTLIAVIIGMAAEQEIRAAEIRSVASVFAGREIHDSLEAMREIQRQLDQYHREYD